MQRDFEIEQEKNRKKEEEVREIATTVIPPGLEIRAGQRTMSGLTVDLTGQTFVLPVVLTGQNLIVLKMK